MGFSRDNFSVKTPTKDEHWGSLCWFSPFKILSLSCLFSHSGHVGKATAFLRAHAPTHLISRRSAYFAHSFDLTLYIEH